MLNYIAVVHKTEISDYGVSFPDFPGCITAGATLDEAREMAQEALQFHIEGMIEDGEALPERSDIETVAREDAFKNTVKAYFLVSVKSPKKAPVRPVRINATIDPDLLKAIDGTARAMGLTRSGFLAHAAQEILEHHKH